jgi:hypothetical protein
MAEPKSDPSVPLVRNLAVVTQLHLPGTAGRLAQQIRDLESAAPAFADAGLVRKVPRPVPVNVRAAGIASATPPPARVMGGFLYAAGAVRLDVLVDDNRVSTGTQDSVCEVDDIDFEDQRNRLRLIGIRQAYQLADAAMRDGERRDLLLLDSPLLLSRSMVAPREEAAHRAHREAYEAAASAVAGFWANHRDQLFPWADDGPVVVGIGTGRYAAITQLATQDLRSADGRGFVLPGEAIDRRFLDRVEALQAAVATIGQQRFLQGLLGPYTRTAAYRLNVQSPRMEPAQLAEQGVVGFHFKGAEGTSARFAHMLGAPDLWPRDALDRVAGLLMALSAVGGREAVPLPLLLAHRELRPLDGFLNHYALSVRGHLRSRKLEQGWLDGFDDLD